MTPQEEKLVLELHSQWGNRWSRIARRLPGRTDNEIKNYWRTHMRKQAQERKRAVSPSSSSSNCCSSSSSDPTVDTQTTAETYAHSHPDRASPGIPSQAKNGQQEKEEAYSMDEIWKDITSPDEEPIKPVYDAYSEEGSSFSCPPIASPLWEYSPNTLWKMADESKMFFPGGQFLSCYEHDNIP